MTNDPMLVIDDTLVLINLSPDNHRVPAHGPNGEAIRYVGERAVPSDHKILIVEEGIEEVLCPYFEVLELPTTVNRCYGNRVEAYPVTIRIWRRLAKQRWQELLRHSVRTADGRRIFTCPIEMLDLPLPGMEEHHLINHWIPEDANELICATAHLSKRHQITDTYSCVGIRKDRSEISPISSLVELARSGQTVQQNPNAEALSDSFLRSSHSVEKDKPIISVYNTYVIMADEPIVCRGTTDMLVLFTLRKAIWYYCSTIPITYRGRAYYIGCLNELSPKGISPYHRREVAVFSGDGLISDRKITEAVYEKYLLMSFI